MADVSALIESMRERADALAELGYKVRFDLTDKNESLLLDATGGAVSLEEGTGEADAVLKLSSDTLDKLVAGRLGAMLAFSTGRLKVEGSRGVALKLASLLGDE
ncbi:MULTISPECIES: SCP2 sterol-binding domain-containing protein [Xanthobacter]|uniref:SCP2 sterol-binding domain-containing protein n=1 Tax=Xanthobacter TaxID=279 RepID=UPI001F3DBB04|nr:MULTISPECIES: SCP2 sterol-binding domain-containing protein [unclassified Xanthobacter]